MNKIDYKKYNYASTFITGLQKPIEKLLKNNLKDMKIIKVLDGLIIYDSSESIDKIINLPFFNNTFVIIRLFQGQNKLLDMIKIMSKDIDLKPFHNFLKNYKIFRIITSKENDLVSIDKKLLYPIEKEIIKQTKLRLNINNPDKEFWFLERKENIGFFMLRLTKNKNKGIEKGKLRSELAYLLNYLSEPDKRDVFLDPFSGLGTLPIMRKNFVYKEI